MSGRRNTRKPPAMRSPSPPRTGDALALAPVLAALSLVYVAMVGWVWSARLAFPFELEWLEGVALEHVQRLRAGLPLYTPPSLEWVPLNYTPLYFWLSALSAGVFGETFLAMRLVSVLAALGAAAAVWALVRAETERAAPAWLAVGLFAATFRLGGAWLDVARADSLHLALLLGGALVARIDGSRWRMPLVAGSLFALAFMTKQSAVVAVAPLVAWLAFRDPRRGLVLVAVFAGLSVAGFLALDLSSGGWFRYYTITVPGFHPRSLSLLWSFPVDDVLRWFAPTLAVLALALSWPRDSEPGTQWGFQLALAAGLVGLAWSLRLYPGGFANVLLTAHAAFAILGAVACASLLRRGAGIGALAAGLIVLQLVLLAWNPRSLVPVARDRAAGETLLEGLRSLKGRVYVSSHTYLLARAGRPTHAHVMPLMDLVRDGRGPRERALLGALRDSLAVHAWDHVLLDNRDWMSDEFERAGYRLAARIFPEPDVFWPVTGMRTRPEYLLVSPEFGGAIAGAASQPAGAAQRTNASDSATEK